ncbi:ABC-type Fe3+-hydroxamate transport system, periplasmic component [Corynebacterium variabile]|uniref:ABC-type Fe3+-hydroxamate transport system, periplasmic component n=1 Tax=Corynebacterium variabile TaxID=1727 RepID=A0A0X2NLK5_9CORY|nr:ABC-type Fe3+-hydroxamate transport system, periplasmic component [Corynebacterium variabile]
MGTSLVLKLPTLPTRDQPSFRHRPVTRRAFLGGTVGVAAVALLAACSGDEEDADDSTASSTDSDAQTTRVVALNTGHLDHLLLLGIVPVGLAVAKSANGDPSGIPDYIYDRFGESFDLDAIEQVGLRAEPDVEKIATLEPDLILSNDRADEALLTQLRGITTVVTTNGGSELWKEDLGILADAVGKREEADDLLAAYEKNASDWADNRGNDAVVSLVRGRNDEYILTGPSSLSGSVVEDAGLTRPDGQRFSDTANHDLSVENTDQLDADYLFYSFDGGAESLTDSASWRNLEVVKAGNAYAVDMDAWFLNASLVAAQYILDDLKDRIGE